MCGCLEVRHGVAVNSSVRVNLTVNGQNVTRTVDARTTLADFLRDDLGLTGTHLGCEHGVCGACTVIVDGATVRSCILYAAQLEKSDVMTIEAIVGDEGALHPIQEALTACHGLQCGFCTPGFVMTIFEFLSEATGPTDDQTRQALSGNLCRCTGYETIIGAVTMADQIWERSVSAPGSEPRSEP